MVVAVRLTRRAWGYTTASMPNIASLPRLIGRIYTVWLGVGHGLGAGIAGRKLWSLTLGLSDALRSRALATHRSDSFLRYAGVGAIGISGL